MLNNPSSADKSERGGEFASICPSNVEEHFPAEEEPGLLTATRVPGGKQQPEKPHSHTQQTRLRDTLPTAHTLRRTETGVLKQTSALATDGGEPTPENHQTSEKIFVGEKQGANSTTEEHSHRETACGKKSQCFQEDANFPRKERRTSHQ